jgi:hypothetical protein
MRKNKAYSAILILALLIIGAAMLKNQSTTDLPEEKTITIPAEKNQPLVTQQKPSTRTDTAPSHQEQAIQQPEFESNTIGGTLREREVIEQWEINRGYMPRGSSKEREYASYDLETLEKLAESGDMLAMTALADRYALKGDSKAKHTAQLKAVVLGSTFLFMDLGITQENIYRKNKNSDNSKEYAIETLALYKTATLRGDESFELNMARVFIKKNNLHITEEDHEKINQRARKIYEELQNARHNSGLGDFDNSVPPEVQKMFFKLRHAYAQMDSTETAH